MSSSGSMSSTGGSLSPDNVRLVLLPAQNFFLEIPIDLISDLCLNPRRYLAFLGWCILGEEGVLALDEDGDEIIDLDGGEINDGGTYYYVANTDLAHAVDPEVIRLRTNVPSETTGTRDAFRAGLLERDLCCVWTGLSERYGGEGMHIIPYKRGSELRLIIENRPSYEENVTDLVDINDMRNGVFASSPIHFAFDKRDVVVLKTPNHLLRRQDIPAHPDRQLREETIYPASARYTLQWLVTPDPMSLPAIPKGADAAFKRFSGKPKPSAMLLHYNYGAAAVKQWGHNVEVLRKAGKSRQPPKPAPTQSGPSKTIHDRKTAIEKRAKAMLGTGTGTGVGAGTGTGAGTGAVTGEVAESEVQATWDEDDVMLFFWGNSKAATQRYQEKVSKKQRHVEDWREGVSQAST